MSVSEVLEILGAILLVCSAALAFGAAAAVLVAGVALVYFAHVYDDTPAPPAKKSGE